MIRPIRRLFVLPFLLLFAARYASATPPWSASDYAAYAARNPAAMKPALRPRISELVPPAASLAAVEEYSLLFEYVQICDFLAMMQESNPASPDFGGMHEGETPDLWAIVQTDNTQEAIRVWSAYAAFSNDLETYRQNVESAWIYTLNYPAYSEEGAESDYYRIHNCGWALVAESRYRQVYGEATYLSYADSCAAYIETHRLPYTGFPDFYMRLHPLVEGWAAGALYDYGVEQSHPEALSHALLVGQDVQDWIEANPNRLNNNEIWAMCGGTALWGVCRSQFAADPAAGQVWLPQVLPYMDTYASFGEWNNSWNVWYAHSYHASAAVLNDSTYTAYAVFLVDTLLDADTDNDGGITATSTDPPTADQSWVSCYLDYMGLESLIYTFPPLDAAAFGFLSPDTLLPIAEGEPVEVSVLVANSGTQPFGNLNINLSGAFSSSASTYLEFADIDTPSLGLWTPTQPGYAELTMTLSPGGAVVANDTASIWVQILGWGAISGEVNDQSTGEPIGANLYFYREGFPPEVPLYWTTTNPLTGYYQMAVTEGQYRVVVHPWIPYTDREQNEIAVLIGDTTAVNFQLLPAPLLLADDDDGGDYESFYTEPLANAGYDVYYWDKAVSLPEFNPLLLFDAVVWFTGNSGSLSPQDQTWMAAYLDSGGSLLLTGQNIAENLAADPFLVDYLGCNFVSPSSGQLQVFGVASDPVTAGLSLLLVGFGGAGNQNSTDIIAPQGSGLESMTYSGAAQPTAAVRLDAAQAGYNLLFLAFGLEGASGLGSSATRQEFLQAVMDWFEIPTAVPAEATGPLPRQHDLLQVYPDPFNAVAQLQITLSQPAETELAIFNVLGQRIDQLILNRKSDGRHIIPYRFSPNLGSGVYFFVLTSGESQIAVRGTLLR